MQKTYDIVALGESLIDFVPAGKNELGMPLFSCNPGGAPANVLAMFSKLGGKSAFIGKVGRDAFGQFLISNMASAGIDTSGVLQDPEVHTTLAFVQLDEHGDRSFSFYRDPGADIMLRTEEVSGKLISDCRIFHFGSVSLTAEPCRSATLNAAAAARAAGALISYDPNYRPLLWDSEAYAVAEMKAAIGLSDVLKVSEEELRLLTGKSDLAEGAEELAAMGPAAVLVTLGAGGAFYYTAHQSDLLPTYNVKTVDTTGAGDAFLGALLWRLREKSARQLAQLSRTEWISAVQFANASGSLTTTRKGAIPAMPDRESIEECIRNTSLLAAK